MIQASAIPQPPPPVREVHGTFDFETKSAAGYFWDASVNKWKSLKGARTKGLSAVGAAAYSEHPSTDVFTLTYKLPKLWFDQHDSPRAGGVKVRWRPGLPNPQELFDYLAGGGLLEAHNVMFERLIWENVCVRRYGWPSLTPFQYQLRCSMAKARVNSLPGALDDLGNVLRLNIRKDAEGKRLIKKFSMPRDPTKADPRVWITRADDPEDAERFDGYCDTDVEAEEQASATMWPMSAAETQFWLVDQEINWRGIGVDREGIRNCIAVLEQALERYGDECREITGFNPTQLAELKGWMSARGFFLPSMDEEALDHALGPSGGIPPHPPGGTCLPRRVLEIRQLIGSASVKKLFAMENQASNDNRLRNLIVHHGARTGRPTGEGPQPLNLPKAGPDLAWCGGAAQDGYWLPVGCRKPFKPTLKACPWCAAPNVSPKREWGSAECKATGTTYLPVDTVLEVMRARSLDLVEWYFGDAVLAISGCIRGLFTAAPGHDLIASDFTAIEAVVTARLSGEEWRIQAFRDNLPIYLLSAGKITGRSLEWYEAYRKEHGQHHPDRQKIGKVNELANGFGGWIGASKAFGSTEPDEVIKQQVLAWRAASPTIPEMWGGQTRREGRERRQEYFGFEGAAVSAISHPGVTFIEKGIAFTLRGARPRVLGEPTWNEAWGFREENVLDPGDDGQLIIRLLSGRELTYHSPRLSPSSKSWASPWEVDITYMTHNSNPKYGAMGWVPMSTYGGRLTENIVQAIAHDILRHAILALRAAGYPTVLHVYDEIVVEVPHGLGSIEEVERIMSTMPWWAWDWPIRAHGGWRGFRFRKG